MKSEHTISKRVAKNLIRCSLRITDKLGSAGASGEHLAKDLLNKHSIYMPYCDQDDVWQFRGSRFKYKFLRAKITECRYDRDYDSTVLFMNTGFRIVVPHNIDVLGTISIHFKNDRIYINDNLSPVEEYLRL